MTTAYYVLPEFRGSIQSGGKYLTADRKGRFAVDAGSADEKVLQREGAVQITAGGAILGDALATGSASPGSLGEYFDSAVDSAHAVPLTTATGAQIAVLNLPAGDFDIDGYVGFVPAPTTNIVSLQGSSSKTTAQIDAGSGYSSVAAAAGVVPGANNLEMPLSCVRYSSANPQTVYLNALAAFSVAALSAYGRLRARRAG